MCQHQTAFHQERLHPDQNSPRQSENGSSTGDFSAPHWGMNNSIF